jgi:hypothetical protein
MPAPTMLFAIGVELIIVDILRVLKVPAPCRISSLPQGAPLRPGIYAYIEDICGVDGSGGTQFRQRLNLRYQASKAFREMLHRQTLFWAIGAIACAVACTIIVFTIQRDAAYVVRIPTSRDDALVQKLIHNRLDGSCRSCGRASGLRLPSPGSSAISRASMRSGLRPTSRRSVLVSSSLRFLFSFVRIARMCITSDFSFQLLLCRRATHMAAAFFIIIKLSFVIATRYHSSHTGTRPAQAALGDGKRTTSF